MYLTTQIYLNKQCPYVSLFTLHGCGPTQRRRGREGHGKGRATQLSLSEGIKGADLQLVYLNIFHYCNTLIR